jgi:hypothetical protein
MQSCFLFWKIISMNYRIFLFVSLIHVVIAAATSSAPQNCDVGWIEKATPVLVSFWPSIPCVHPLIRNFLDNPPSDLGHKSIRDENEVLVGEAFIYFCGKIVVQLPNGDVLEKGAPIEGGGVLYKYYSENCCGCCYNCVLL